MNKTLLSIFFAAFVLHVATAQQPQYTEKSYVTELDPAKFKDIVPGKDGFSRTYLALNPQIYDVDDNDTARIMSFVPAVVVVEGPKRNGLKNGLFTYYVMDGADPTKRFKIWEQDIVDDKLHGQWKFFDVRGNLVEFRTFSKDSLNGISKVFRLDGSVQDQKEFFNGRTNYVMTIYSRSGMPEEQMTHARGLPNGLAKKYYSDGKVKEEVMFKDNVFHGRWKYYYPSGNVWIEMEYKDGKPWNVFANYDVTEKKRNAGTLKNGNGTVIYYNDDGTVRETSSFINGTEQ